MRRRMLCRVNGGIVGKAINGQMLQKVNLGEAKMESEVSYVSLVLFRKV